MHVVYFFYNKNRTGGPNWRKYMVGEKISIFKHWRSVALNPLEWDIETENPNNELSKIIIKSRYCLYKSSKLVAIFDMVKIYYKYST